MGKYEIHELPLIPLEKLIPSADVRKQCEKEGRVFNLREQATLVWNNPELMDRKVTLILQMSVVLRIILNHATTTKSSFVSSINIRA